jgi:hypothetical protein
MPDQVRHDGQSLGTFLNYDTLCLAWDKKGQINHESKKLYRDSKPSYYSFTAYRETTHCSRQLTLGNSQRLHKLFNEHLTSAYGLSFGIYHFITSLITMVIEINTVSLASVIIP